MRFSAAGTTARWPVKSPSVSSRRSEAQRVATGSTVRCRPPTKTGRGSREAIRGAAYLRQENSNGRSIRIVAAPQRHTLPRDVSAKNSKVAGPSTAKVTRDTVRLTKAEEGSHGDSRLVAQGGCLYSASHSSGLTTISREPVHPWSSRTSPHLRQRRCPSGQRRCGDKLQARPPPRQGADTDTEEPQERNAGSPPGLRRPGRPRPPCGPIRG